jgi:hypothetical protein
LYGIPTRKSFQAPGEQLQSLAHSPYVAENSPLPIEPVNPIHAAKQQATEIE